MEFIVDWKISISAILVLLLGAILTHRLTKSREDQSNYRKRVSEFKESFVPFVRELEHPDSHPTLLLLTNFPAQDELARKLVLHMPKRKKQKFTALWQRYAELHRQKEQQGILSQLATEVDDIALASPGNPNALDYVRDQTIKRKNVILSHINNAIAAL